VSAASENSDAAFCFCNSALFQHVSISGTKNLLSSHLMHCFPFPLFSVATVLVIVGSVVGCSSSSSPKKMPQPPATLSTISSDPDVILGTTDIESVQAFLVSTSPMRAKLVVKGLLNDGATSIHEIRQTRVTGGFVITISTTRERAAMATLALVPFEREIILDLSATASGPCEIRVNGKSTILQVP